jgi:heat shock protein HspQ
MEVIVWRQQRMTPDCDDRSVFGLGQDRRSRLFRSGLEIIDIDPLSPPVPVWLRSLESDTRHQRDWTWHTDTAMNSKGMRRELR